MLTKDHLPLLRHVRGQLEDETELFICYALARASTVVDDDSLYYAAQEYIEIGIDRLPYLTWWLRERVPDPVWWLQESATTYCAPNRTEAFVQLRMLRLAWLDRLIDNLEQGFPC